MSRLPHIERTSPRVHLQRQAGDDGALPLYAITTPDGAVLHRDLTHARACALFDELAGAAGAPAPIVRPRRRP